MSCYNNTFYLYICRLHVYAQVCLSICLLLFCFWLYVRMHICMHGRLLIIDFSDCCASVNSSVCQFKLTVTERNKSLVHWMEKTQGGCYVRTGL